MVSPGPQSIGKPWVKHHIHVNSLGRKDRKCGMKEHLHQGEHLTLKLIHKDTKNQCWLAPQRPLGSELRSDWELPAKQLAPHGLEKLCPTELSAVMEMFTIHCRLGDSSPWVSHFCIFESRGTECLFFWTLFQGHLYSQQLWKEKVVSSSRAKDFVHPAY